MQEFVGAFADAKENKLSNQFGVLLSGPNGVGKSAVGVQALLSCMARGLPVVYIPSAHAWVEAARKGLGEVYFLECFMALNADMVAANPALREALLPALRDSPLDSTLMHALRKVLEIPGFGSIGVIVDEVQAITQVLAKGAEADADPADKAAESYFREVGRFKSWDSCRDEL